jgi:hypothetical protein
METKKRRPIGDDHPVIAAARKVLAEVGGPLKVNAIFDRAHEKGLLPKSSSNTIRGRLSQHVQHVQRGLVPPAVVPLPHRRGWMLAEGRLREVKLTEAWAKEAGAPDTLVELIHEEGSNGRVALSKVLSTRLDRVTLTWVLDTLPFDDALRARLLNADGAEGRREVLRGLAEGARRRGLAHVG